MALERLSSTTDQYPVATLSDACICAELKWTVDDSITAPDGTTQEYVENVTASIRKSIIKSIPDSIREQIPQVSHTKAPLKILNAVKLLLADEWEANHRRLGVESRGTNLIPGQTMLDYMALHRTLRRRMV